MLMRKGSTDGTGIDGREILFFHMLTNRVPTIPQNILSNNFIYCLICYLKYNLLWGPGGGGGGKEYEQTRFIQSWSKAFL